MQSSLNITLVLGGLLLLAACNTTAGIGKDISGAGSAISTSAHSVQHAQGQPSNPGHNNSGAVRQH